ncbi:SMP-30/gluconolactonase/LRE family protein [Streptomyces sp. NPDC007983]|uniref:SMP-30/gluconolactonase/LRE family protein n=1 Tax=Streptomyces sp. NPDC007983 TaxID=3364800 RepID=UPI0036E782F5
MSPAIEPVGDTCARFGEGPVWDPTANAVLWVDITGGAVLRTTPADTSTRRIELGGEVAAVFPTPTGTMLVARDSTLVEVSGAAVVREVAGVPSRPRMRFNDGMADPRGRLLIGTLHADKTPGTAALYRLDGDGVLRPVVTGVTVSNGLGWSPDGRALYYVDTPRLRIDRFDYDLDDGVPHNRRTLADVSGLPGRPDGLTVDAEGCVWVAMIGGGELRRFTPNGRLDRVVPLPVSHPTSVAFGAQGLAELFITSAVDPLSVEERRDQPLAGRLLRLDPGTSGLPTSLAVIP